MTVAGSTEHVVMPATYVPSRLDPGQADPFPPWDVPSPPRMSPHESACLGLARSQPWARDKFKGPSGGKCRVLVTNGNKGITIVTVSTVTTTSFFWGVTLFAPTALWLF